MKYVYILQSELDSEKFYIGSTIDLKKRLKEHNAGQSIHTNKYKPCVLRNYFAFDDSQKADKFEKYLKTASGRAFTKKHF